MESKNFAGRYHNTSKSLLAQIIDFLPDPTFAIDLTGKVLVWNRAMEAITQIKAEDIVGRGDYEYSIPFYGERRPILIDMVLKANENLEKTYSYIRHDGDNLYAEAVVLLSKKYLRGKASPFYDDDGRIIGAIESIWDITDRKSTEEALRESEEKYRVLVENANEVILVAQDGKIKFTNRREGNILGYTNEELMAVPFVNFIHPDDRDMVVSSHQERLKGEILSEIYSFRVIDRAGDTKWVEVNAVPISWEGRSATLNFYTDITERKLADETVRESEKRYRTIFENAVEGIFQTTPEGRFLSVNPALARMFGFSSPQEVIDTIQDLGREIYVNPVDRERMLEILWREGKADGYEFEGFRQDGTRFWVSINVHIVRDAEGNALYIEGTSMDITERKLIDQELKESRANLSALIESTTDMIWSVDLNYRLMTFNQTLNEHFLKEYGIEARIGATPGMLLPPERALLWKPIYDSAMKDGPYMQEYSLSDGRVLELFLHPILQDNKPIGVSVFGKDVTERKRAEEEKKSLEMQLIQAQKMESIGTLAGGIAHDFNNILTPIIGFTELAIDDIPEDTPTHDNLSEILFAANRARDLVGQILTFSRKSETVFSPLSLHTIIKESLKMLRSVTPSTIEIRQDLPDSGIVMSNPTQIHQIIMNLCTNAVHAMNESGGVMKVSLKKVEMDQETAAIPGIAPGAYLRITVSDTGHGMTPEVMECIFEPYYTTKETGHGTGLGLSVVHGIVKSHGGSIICRSIPKKGATFEVYLPEIKAEKKTDQPSEKDHVPTGTERILFIDDEVALTRLAEMMLSRLGYKVTTKTSSVEAFDFFRERPHEFDLLITDMTMPVMTGDRLAQKAMEIRPDIPVILCSGYNEHISVEKIKKIGIREFVVKPFERNVLAKTIREVLDGE